MMSKYSDYLDVPYVEDIEVVKNNLVIKGSWPNPGWKLKKYMVDRHGDTLHVFILGESKSSGKINIQIMNPFKYIIPLKDIKEKKGNFRKIIVYSRDGKEHVVEVSLR